MKRCLHQLGDLLLSVSSASPAVLFGDQDFKYIDISSVDRNKRCIVEPQVTSVVDAPSRARQVLARDDVIVSTVRPNLNTVAVVDGANCDAIASTGFCVLRPDPKVLNSRFLFHWVSSAATVARLVSLATGATYPAVSDKIIKSLDIHLPSMQEQQRIAAILDKADGLCHKRQHAIRLADDLLRAVFIDLFGDPGSNPKGWPVHRMGDVIDFRGGSQPPKETFVDDPRPGYVRLVQIRDFKSDRYKTYIPEQLAKRAFDVDDVMIARYGPPVFQILRGLSGSYNVALMKAQPKADILKEIIYWLLQLPAYHDVVVANSERTAGQSGVNLDLLNKLLVPLPPRGVQIEIAKRTTAITALIRKQQEMLRLQDEQYAALQASLLA